MYGKMEKIFKRPITKLADQNPLICEYFAQIAKEDPYGLNVDGFFGRVCSSIEINGLARTCDIYDLDMQIVKLVRIEGRDFEKEPESCNATEIKK